MSNKTQLNQLSKREILESLLQRQQQDASTMNRLILAVAVALDLNPETVAQKFTDNTATSEFADKFNKALDAEYAKKQSAPLPENESVSTDVNVSPDSEEVAQD